MQTTDARLRIAASEVYIKPPVKAREGEDPGPGAKGDLTPFAPAECPVLAEMTLGEFLLACDVLHVNPPATSLADLQKSNRKVRQAVSYRQGTERRYWHLARIAENLMVAR